MIRLTSWLYYILDALLPNLPPLARQRAALARRLLGSRIGRGTEIFKGVYFGSNGIGITIGEHCVINYGTILETEHGRSTITIGDNVFLGHQCLVTVGSHQIGPSEKRAGEGTCIPVVIERGVWMGARAIVLQGVTVGAGVIVGAGALVNKSVSRDILVGGVPAKTIRNLQ